MAEWPLIDMDLPESVQVAGCRQKKDKHDRSSPPPCLLSEPKKSASRTTSIPHLSHTFLPIRLKIHFHLTTLSRPQ